MWKVTNEQNKDILTHFHEQVAIPLFELLILLASEREKGNPMLLNKPEDLFKTDEFTLLTAMQQDALRIVLKLEIDNGQSCFVCFTNTIQMVSSSDLEKLKIEYEKDYEQVNNYLNFNLKKEVLPADLHKIFHTYFFKCMDVEPLWVKILPQGKIYSKSEFHKNFREENGVSVCPYCDIKEMTSTREVHIEHFLPRHSFPFLSMTAFNLFSACDNCNSIYVKGPRTKDVITTPLHENIGDALEFDKPLVGGPVQINYNQAREDLDNYMNLLKLQNRYNDKQLIQTLEIKLKTIDNYFSQINVHEGVSKGKINLYFSSQTRTNALTLILSQLFRNYDRYKNAP